MVGPVASTAIISPLRYKQTITQPPAHHPFGLAGERGALFDPGETGFGPSKDTMRQPEQKASELEISAELPARFAGFMERSSPSEKQVLLLIFRERTERRGAFRLQRALASVVRELERGPWRERRSGRLQPGQGRRDQPGEVAVP